MTHPRGPAPVSAVSSQLAANRLGVADIVSFNLTAAAPLTVVAGVIPTGFAVTGITGIPVAFLAVAVVLAVFAVGFVTMARRVANAGAFYAYISHGIGRPLGVGAAWVALVAYNALQVGLYGLIGAATTPLLAGWFGWQLPWWMVALAAWGLVAVLGLRRVDLNGRILAVLLIAEIAVILVADAGNLLHPADGRITMDTLAPANLAGPGLGALLVLAVLGFVGFENSVVFSEESRNRHRTVPVATYTSIGIIAVLYAGSAWALTVATGPDHIATAAAEQGPELLFTLAADRLGPAMADIGHALFATSLLAAMISFHNTTARYTFALGREGVLPTLLGRTNLSGAPRGGSLTQSAVGLAVIVTYAAAGWDPVTRLFFWAGSCGGLGVLLLIATTAIAVVVYFARNRGLESVWQLHIFPVAAAVLMLGVAWLAVTNFPTVLGPAPTWLPTAVPLAYLAVAVAGVGYAWWLRRQHPQVYGRIGLGAHSALAAPPIDVLPRHRQEPPANNRDRTYQ